MGVQGGLFSHPPSAGRKVCMEIRLEMISWVNSLAGGPGSGSMEVREEVPAGATVRDALKQYSARHPKLSASLWDEGDRNEIGPHLEVIVNDAILGVHHQLDSTLAEGDHIILAGQYIGG